jgi:hypothetical protein
MTRSIWTALLTAAVAALLPCASALAALPAAGVAASPVEGRLHAGRGTAFSTNWSGYAAYGTTFESASGSWTQPPANCETVAPHQYAIAAFWVGLDGWESNTVEQTGTESDCSGNKAVYRAWYELYPERGFLLGGKVEAGDALHVEVTQGTLTLADSTQGWVAEEHFLPGSLAFSSADWIAEAPAKNHLTPFGSVHFEHAAASTGGVKSGPIDSKAWSNDAVTLVGNRNSLLAEPGALESGGTAFTIGTPEEQPGKGKGGEHGDAH